MPTIGIDNGISGALAVLDDYGAIMARIAMPTCKSGKGLEVDVEGLAECFATYRRATVVLERPTKHSKGILSLCSTWHCYGCIRTALILGGMRYHEVLTPATWQRLFWSRPKMAKGQKFDTKAAALRVATQLWPDEDFRASARSSTPHDGIVDALLIAEYGRRVLGSIGARSRQPEGG